MEEVETFLCSDGVDLRRDADGVAEKIMQSKDLMRVFSRRVGYATVTTELERGLHVCALIGSRDKDFRARFLEEVTVEQFVKLMNRERGNVAVQKKLMYFVNVLAVDDSIRENIVEGGAGEATVAVINAHLENDIVLERALMALSRLTIGKLALKLRLASAGGLRALYEVMDKHRKNVALGMTGTIALRNLIHGCPENVMLAKHLGIPKLLLEVATELSNYTKGQAAQLLVTLMTMLRADEDLKRSFGNEEGYLAPALEIVRISQDSKQLTEAILELLSCIAGGRNESILNAMGDTELIPVVVQRVKLYEDDAKICEQACALFRAMAFTKQNRERLKTEGGLQATIEVLRTRADSTAVVEQSLCVLSNACFSSAENQEFIGKSGGVEETVRVMELHRDCETIQDFGCRALRNFANNCEYNIRLEGELGAVQGIVLAMMSFPDATGLNEQAVAALLNLARLEQNSLRMLEHDVPEVIHKSLQNIDSEELNKKSTRLINILETPVTTSPGSSSLVRSLSRGLSRSLSRGTSVSMSRAKTEQLRERGMSRRISRMRSQSQQRTKADEAEDSESALVSAFNGLKRAVSTRGRD